MTAEKIALDYQESFNFLQAKKQRQANQLVLLNNLRKPDQFISSTLLLTLFNRLLSSLYDDKIQVKFLPTQGISQEQLNAFNILAQSDYQEMNMSKLEYDWVWDTLFFGRGYVETLQFDMKKKVMTPHVINPLAFGYDPYFANPQEWRYYWKWLTKNKWELEALIKAKVLKIKKLDEIPSGVDPFLWQYKVRVENARIGVPPSIQPADNSVYQILEYFGYNKKGKKCIYWTDKHCATVIYEQELDLGDGDEIVAPDGQTIETDSKWPIVMMEAFREPHSSIPFSVADLLEDKHRAKSVLLNLTYIAAKDQANPLYGYNPDKVKDVSQFLQRQINQHIPMEDPDSAWPLNKAPSMTADLMNFISMMQQEANEPIGTGMAMQPDAGGQETATEVAIDQQLSDLAQSLQSKVMQFGRAELWSHWFQRYALHGEDLGEKMANIVGVKGVDTQMVDLSLFNTDFPPGVLIQSAKEAEYKDLVKRRDFMQLYPQLAQTIDPNSLRNFNKHVFFPLFLQDPSLVDVLFPNTVEEIRAQEENLQLQSGMLPDVLPTDDHTSHIYIHRMSLPKTWASWAHIQWHEEALQMQQQQMAMQQQLEMQGGPPESPQNPMEAASPLAGEINPNNSIAN